MKYLQLFLLLLGVVGLTMNRVSHTSSAAEEAVPIIIDAQDAQLAYHRGVQYYTDQRFSGTIVRRDATGNVFEQTPYVGGLKHGVVEAWYANGQPKHERLYVEGKREGVHQGWWPDGTLRFSYSFINDLHDGTANEWYPSGLLAKAFTYEAGKEVGSQQMWRPDGTIRANYVVKDGRRYGLIGSKPCTSNQ